MVSLWVAIPAVLLLGLLWYLTWNAAFTARIVWEARARRALDAAEAWRARAERAEEQLAHAAEVAEESTRLVKQAEQFLKEQRDG